MKRPVIAISAGCPCGVGPEVALLGAARCAARARPVLVLDRRVLDRAAALRRVARRRVVPVRDAASAAALTPGQIGFWEPSAALAELPSYGAPTAEAGAAQLAWIDQATDLVTAGIAAALVTGPVSKAAIASSGAPGAAKFRGHTEHLAERLGAPSVTMAFAGGALVTALVTTHLAIADVPRAITRLAVAETAVRLVDLARALGKKAPRIAVASLNPHAGEGGLLGREEIDTIAPGVELAREQLRAAGTSATITGPTGAETAIRHAAAGAYDGVVTMYHDQATIPSKLLGFGEAVNITLGLPIVRTSVDHGTGYDVAGTGKASARGMVEAIGAALRLVPRVRSPAAGGRHLPSMLRA